MSVDKLVDSVELDSDLGNIATAIRDKGGTTGSLSFPSGFINAIYALNVFREYSGQSVTFNAYQAVNIRKLIITMDPIQAGSGTPSPDNVRTISGRNSIIVYHSDNDTSNPTTITTTVPTPPTTVYGGYLDLISGKLIINQTKISFAPTIISTWFDNDINRNTLGFYLQANDFNNLYPTPVLIGQSGTIGIGMFEEFNRASAYNNDNPYVGQILFVNNVFNRIEARVPKSELIPFSTYVESKTAVTTWLASNPIQVCYTIAEQEYSVTPQTIQTLIGENNMWTPETSINVEFII